jgi:peptidoglycan/xylan/chitin deacetylase (PgdA/CDA1 family)
LLLLGIAAACAPARPTATPTASLRTAVVTLTFDDGDADNFAVLPLLQRYGLHATFFIPSGHVGRPNAMTWNQLKALAAAGNEIGGHTLDHLKLGTLDTGTLRHEICDDRRSLADHGLAPVSFAYPFGNYDAAVHDMVKECGYAGARTIAGGPQPLPLPDPYAVRAMPYIVRDTDVAKMQRYVNQARGEGGQWVVFTFHHVCDGCDYYAISPDLMDRLLRWLSRQQTLGNLKVETFGAGLGAER